MEPIRNLFGERVKSPSQTAAKKDRRTERGELLKYFQSKINPGRIATGRKPLSLPAIGKRLEGLDMHTLKFMKSYMKDLERTGSNPAKWFWWSTDPKKHVLQNIGRGTI